MYLLLMEWHTKYKTSLSSKLSKCFISCVGQATHCSYWSIFPDTVSLVLCVVVVAKKGHEVC